MPRASQAALMVLPNVVSSLRNFTVDELKWYATAWPGPVPSRKEEIVAFLARPLTEPAPLQELWAQLTTAQQELIADLIHNFGGRYDSQIVPARHPKVAAPSTGRGYSSYSYGRNTQTPATPFDLFFAHNYEHGLYIPPDLAARLQAFVSPPPPPQLASQDAPPTLRGKKGQPPPEQWLTGTEAAVVHDLTATLELIAQGKVSVSASTRLPGLPVLRQLRGRLLIGEYFADEYARAEDAVRPLALVMLVQAARWAAPVGAAGTKLELTKSGHAVLAGGIGAAQVREAWERWVKTDLLDELARVRAIKGQGSKGARLSKPAERRDKLVTAMRLLPPGRWIAFDEFLRYMRAEQLMPVIERNVQPALRVGGLWYDDDLGYELGRYWDIITGSYLRVVVWEYAATLGLVEMAYTRPEETPHSFGRLDGLDEPYLSRYDGLVAVQLTPLGAYVLGLAGSYTPPAPAVAQGPPLLRVLPNLDVVITDASRLLPNSRALLERIGSAQSQDVYHLQRDLLLEAVQNGLSLDAVQTFLAAHSGSAVADLPSTVRVFFADLARRLDALRDGGRRLVLEADDPYLLTELANDPSLRGLVQLGRIGERPVLLVAEEHEVAARRQLKKLGYVPKK